MFPKTSLLFLSFLAAVYAQQAGTLTAEVHPPLTWELCTAPGSCTTQSSTVVLDANWRWLHDVSSSTNCYTGNQWNAELCPDPVTCATNCALDGADYESTYGISSSGDALTLNFVTGSNVGSRVYLMAPGSTTEYQMFKPNNQEFTFDVNVSELPCGLNGALYFSEMDSDGGVARFPANKAGANYGTGYCDSQCPMDMKFINGQANMLNWTATSTNSGNGKYGTCCNEMDIWEANSISEAYTAHPCSVNGQTECSGDQCNIIDRYGGLCDPDGCDFNSYRLGNTSFYGPGKTIDTTKVITVVTQFITDDGTDTGTLSAIKRIWVQDGIIYQNSETNVAGVTQTNQITDTFCTQQKTAFGDTNVFTSNGALANLGTAFSQGVVLVLSIWDDYTADMLWLDSDYPLTKSATTPGVARGTCATTSGAPATVEADSPNAQVIFSNIKFGPLNSTYSGTNYGGGGGSTTTTTTTKGSTTTTTTTSAKTTTTTVTTTTTSSGATQTEYGQCGGTGYTGPTVCVSPYTCQYSNPYYSQCL